jgi:hypothetical protein
MKLLDSIFGIQWGDFFEHTGLFLLKDAYLRRDIPSEMIYADII